MIKIEGKTEKDNLCPRIGGEAFIKEKDWPRNNNGVPLFTLFYSIRSSFFEIYTS